MPRKRIRIITKKQKVTEAKSSAEATSLEHVVREPSFLPGRRRTSRPLLQLPFPTTEQAIEQTLSDGRLPETKPEESNREAFSYERPGVSNTGNGTTYRIPGATGQSDNHVYRSTTENKIDEDRRDRFNHSAPTDTNRLRNTDALASQKQDRYQTNQTYQSSAQAEKKSTKELERSKF